jgi:hypothetical protein
MSDDDLKEPTDLVPASTPAEKGLDVAAVVASAVPWIGGPVSAVLGGMSLGRKLGRVREVLEGLADDLRDFKSTASEQYARTEEFEELLEAALRGTAEERNKEKRRIYRSFLTDAIRSPGQPYEEQLRFLRTLEELQPDHLRIVKALSQQPEGGDGITGSPANTLARRLPEMSRERIADLVAQLNDMRVTGMTSLNVMMTYHGAQDLRSSITAYGRRLLRFIVAE